jgi:hypothetical protein
MGVLLPAPVPAPARNILAAIRVAAFVDGFNPYHALRDLGRDHLKWLNLWVRRSVSKSDATRSKSTGCSAERLNQSDRRPRSDLAEVPLHP